MHNVVVTCTSTWSLSSDSTLFVLTLQDYCYTATLTAPPTFATPPPDIHVWDVQVVTFADAVSSIPADPVCSTFSYAVTLTGLDPAKYSLSGTSITFSPDDLLTDLGLVTFTVTATLDTYGQTIVSAS